LSRPATLRSPAPLASAVPFQRSTDPRHLHSFPTRRSSDLAGDFINVTDTVSNVGFTAAGAFTVGAYLSADNIITSADTLIASRRSEEHTSELQSRRDLVCRLLLEKKKNLRDNDEQHAKHRP